MKAGFRRFARMIINSLPPKVAARLEYNSGRSVYFYPWGSAMNGQTARLEICRRCLTQIPINVVVETGTYRGVTTEWIASFGQHVYSIEIDPKSYYFAKLRLAKYENVDLILGDSKSAISEQLSDALRGKNLFAYLDAHWREHLPLREEIADLAALTSNFVILIDDFQVPEDEGYEYDDYGVNGACTLEYIEPALSDQMAVFFPTTRAVHESGRKRGYVVIGCGKDIVSKLESIELLKRHV